MDGNTKFAEITLDQFKNEVVPGLILIAADDVFWKNAKTLGVELTGKDITKIADVRCLRKTIDASQDCRLKKEKKEDAFLSEKAKRNVMIVFLIIPMLLSVVAIFKG